MERPARRLRNLCTHLTPKPCAQSEAVAEPPATPEQSLTDAERDVCIVRVPLITGASLGNWPGRAEGGIGPAHARPALRAAARSRLIDHRVAGGPARGGEPARERAGRGWDCGPAATP